MASGETPVPFEEAIERIERERKGKWVTRFASCHTRKNNFLS